MDIKTVAFIGLGVMGEAMCRNLARMGSWRVVGYDTRQEPMQRLRADGVTSATSLADAVAGADVVLMCLPGGKEVEAVVRGPGGLLELVRRGQTVVDMSTAPPRLMRELAPAFQAKGVEFADAPVARTRRAAVDGTRSIMVGGSEAVFARLKPILATMGMELTLCGGVGAGQVENYHGHRRSHFVRRGCRCGLRCNQPAGLPWLTAFCTRAAKRKVACQCSVLALLTRALAHNPKFCGPTARRRTADC